MKSVQPWLECCRQRLNFGEFLRVAAEWLAGWLCLFGSLVLVVKLFQPALWPHVLWLALLTFPVAVLAWRMALKRPHTLAESAILLDRKLQTGGLLLAVAESPNTNWQRELPTNKLDWKNSLPRVRPSRFARLILLPLLFAIGACFVPLREAKTSPSGPKKSRIAAVQELPVMLDELKKANALTAEEEAYLREEIDKLVEETADSPPTHEKWERIDTLRNRLHNRSEERLRTVENANRAIHRLAAKDDKNNPFTEDEKRKLEAEILRALKNVKALQTAKTSPSQKPKPAAKTKPELKTETTKSSTKTLSLKSTSSKTPAGKTAKKKTTAKKSKPAQKLPSKTPISKTPGTKTPSKKTTTPKTTNRKTQIGKTTEKKTIRKTQSEKTPGKKTATSKTGTVSKSSPQKNVSKTGSKQVGKSGSNQKINSSAQKSGTKPGGKLPSSLPDISPEMLNQLAKMMQAGEFKLPEDPALREEILKQAQKLLEMNREQLTELKKKYGRQLQDAFSQGLPMPQPPFNTNGKSPGTNPSGKNPMGVDIPQSVEKKGVGFRDVVLPPGFLDKKKDEIVGITGRNPKTRPVKPSRKTNGSLEGATTAGETYKQRYSPRRRKLVKRFFLKP